MAQTDHGHGETGDVDRQLRAISARLNYLLQRLEEQRGKCPTKAEKKYLDCLRKEAKKQMATMTKLQESVEDTMTIMAKSSHALDSPISDKAILQRRDRTGKEMNNILFQVVAGPFQKQYRLIQQKRSIELSERLKPWRATKPAAGQAASTAREECGSSATTSEPWSSTTSTASDLSMRNSHNQSTSSAKDTDPESSSDRSETASISPSNGSSPRISVQDWSILTPPEGFTNAPPLPRKSSRRASHTPRVPSIQFMPPLPPMPNTPPPPVPDTEEPDSASSSNGSASFLLSNLEKRYSLTMATPPATP